MVSGDLLDGRVSWGRAAPTALGPLGSGLAGFWRSGGGAQDQKPLTKTPAHTGGGESGGAAPQLPGQSLVGDQPPRESELVVAGAERAGPAIGLPGSAYLRGDSAERGLGEAEPVLYRIDG
jgi:hypothetical protein